MTQELDDFKLDQEFGKWLTDLRTRAGFSLRDVAIRTGITESRIRSLELGYAERGIKKSEIHEFSKVYGLPESDIMAHAVSD